MGFCGNCGSEQQPGNRFCAACGHDLSTASEQTAPVPVSPPTLPAQSVQPPPVPPARPGPPHGPPTGPPPAAPPPPSCGTPQVDLERIADILLRGNWVAAAATAVTAYVVALLGSLAVVALAAPDLGLWDWLVSVVSLTASVFTLDLTGTFDLDDAAGSGHVGTVPLVLTTLSLGAACVVFRRLTRSARSFTATLGDAARAGLILGVILLLTAIVFRSDLEDQTGDVRELLEWFDAGDLEVSVGPARASALFLGFGVLFGILALACLLRRDWLGPRLQQVHDVVAGPIRAAALLVLSLPVLGILCYGALLTGSDTADEAEDELSWNQTVAVLFVAVSNAGMHFLNLGAGGRWGGSVTAEADGDDYDEAEWGRLGSLVDDDGAWGLWFSVPVMLVVLALLVWFVLKQGNGRRAGASLLAWSGLTFVVFGLLLRMSSFHGSGEVEFEDEEATVSFLGGMPFSESLLLWLITLVLALVVAVIAGAVDLAAIGRRIQELSAQANGGASGAPGGSTPTMPPPSAPPSTPPSMPPPPPPGSQPSTRFAPPAIDPPVDPPVDPPGPPPGPPHP